MLGTGRNRSRSTRFRRAVAWVMASLALLGGRPVVGCLCADARMDAAAGRTCPHCGAAAAVASGPRAGGQKSCCAGHGGRGSSDGGQLGTRLCCSLLVQTHTVPAIVAGAGDELAAAAELAPAASSRLPDARPELAGALHERSTTLPPGDLVIELRRLVV